MDSPVEGTVQVEVSVRRRNKAGERTMQEEQCREAGQRGRQTGQGQEQDKREKPVLGEGTTRGCVCARTRDEGREVEERVKL